MKFKNLKISLFLISYFLLSQISTNASEKYHCEQSLLQVYEKDFKCNDTNNYFLNAFYSDHIDNFTTDKSSYTGSEFIKSSSLIQISERLGFYFKKVNGEKALVYGFPDTRMKRDSNSLWKAFKYEFSNILREPEITPDLNNGFDSSLSSESF